MYSEVCQSGQVFTFPIWRLYPFSHTVSKNKQYPLSDSYLTDYSLLCLIFEFRVVFEIFTFFFFQKTLKILFSNRIYEFSVKFSNSPCNFRSFNTHIGLFWSKLRKFELFRLRRVSRYTCQNWILKIFSLSLHTIRFWRAIIINVESFAVRRVSRCGSDFQIL